MHFFDISDGLAAIYDIGNEMDDLTFKGGDYGIICRMCSPGWPFALTDSRFMDQKKAGVLSTNTGFTGLGLEFRNMPKAFSIYLKDAWEKHYLENCRFANITDSIISRYDITRKIQHTCLIHCVADDCAFLVKELEDDYASFPMEGTHYIDNYTCGYIMDDSGMKGEISETLTETDSLDIVSFIPSISPMDKWVNVKELGVKGDGESDDTAALQKAIDEHDTLYLPQGLYKITDSLIISNDTQIYGMSPISTVIFIEDLTEAFDGVGSMKGLIESAEGTKVIISGIGIDTRAKNPRAAGIIWRSDKDSYMNDVKFLGGHGNMLRNGDDPYRLLYNPSRTGDYDPTRIWDSQFPSLYITRGGGTFKDIWSASPYASSGISISHTDLPGKMIQISLEHHVRKEMELQNVSGWSFYALQTEEEKAEGLNCQPMEIINCKDLTFAEYFLFRVVSVNDSYDTGIRLWGSENCSFYCLHNKAQMQYTFTLTARDMDRDIPAKSPDYALLYFGGDEEDPIQEKVETAIIAEGFHFAQGACLDQKGNLYWCDKYTKEIYRYDITEGRYAPFLRCPFTPSALYITEGDRLIVTVDHTKAFADIDEMANMHPDFSNYHPFYSWFRNRGSYIYEIDIDDPIGSISVPETVSAEEAAADPDAVLVRPAHADYPGYCIKALTTPVKEYYRCADGHTYVEKTIDLGRTLRLISFRGGEDLLISDDADRRLVKYTSSPDGSYLDPQITEYNGQYGYYQDTEGNIYTVDDYLLYYPVNGSEEEDEDAEYPIRIPVPDDAYTIIGNDAASYIIGRHAIYKTK